MHTLSVNNLHTQPSFVGGCNLQPQSLSQLIGYGDHVCILVLPCLIQERASQVGRCMEIGCPFCERQFSWPLPSSNTNPAQAKGRGGSYWGVVCLNPHLDKTWWHSLSTLAVEILTSSRWLIWAKVIEIAKKYVRVYTIRFMQCAYKQQQRGGDVAYIGVYAIQAYRSTGDHTENTSRISRAAKLWFNVCSDFKTTRRSCATVSAWRWIVQRKKLPAISKGVATSILGEKWKKTWKKWRSPSTISNFNIYFFLTIMPPTCDHRFLIVRAHNKTAGNQWYLLAVISFRRQQSKETAKQSCNMLKKNAENAQNAKKKCAKTICENAQKCAFPWKS